MTPTQDRLAGMDFEAHNAEVRAMWKAYHEGKPYRVPVILGTNPRYYFNDPLANPEGWDFVEYSDDPAVMYDIQLHFQRFEKFNVFQDHELGMPERWGIGVDFQNYYEAAWFGCPVEFIEGQVPDALPGFVDCPERVMENGLPDPFGGLFMKGLEFYETMKERGQREGYLDRPVDVWAPGGGTDGPMTVACNLFGPAFVCEAMASEPERLQTLLTFITDATILRMGAWRGYNGLERKCDGFGIADDSIALISTAMYVEHILPHHRRFFEEFGTGKGHGIHLCGNATRHFKTLCEELGIVNFDTGFPVDFGALRRELGPGVTIQGGPHVEFLLSRTPEQVREETRRILQSGVMEGGKFLLREGNNLAPLTPKENTEAMVHAGREFGRYDQGD